MTAELDGKQAIALLVVGLVLFALLIGLATHKSVETVAVHERVWRYYAAVLYDVTTTTVECSPVTNCTGIGANRICTTNMDCKPVTTTTTYTRCENVSTGGELPPTRPQLSCVAGVGDRMSEKVSYHVSYHVNETGVEGWHWAEFGVELWNELAPGRMVEIERTAWYYITSVEPAKQPAIETETEGR